MAGGGKKPFPPVVRVPPSPGAAVGGGGGAEVVAGGEETLTPCNARKLSRCDCCNPRDGDAVIVANNDCRWSATGVFGLSDTGGNPG